VTAKPSLSPWLVAVLFAPTALTLWAIGTGVIALDAQDLRSAYQAIALTQLFLALMVYEILLKRQGQPADAGTGWQGPLIALGALVVTQVSHFATAEKALATVTLLPALAVLAQQVVTIALAEELWFRGLWMRAAAGRPLLAIFGGAAGFGLYHLHQGAAWIATTAALGVLFAVARWYGAPIWSLALAHGLMNWLNRVALPAAKWRFDPTLSRGMFIALILFGAAIIWLFCREPAAPEGSGDGGS
jgi:Type II CAAX prenyl endopeptidase Rce1-like